MSKEQEQIDELRGTLEMLGEECRELRIKLGDHEARLEAMEIAAPVELRRLTYDAVCAAVESDPYARFEVLVDWGHGVDQLKAGSVIRADHVVHLRDFVKHGLQVGLPADQTEVIARMRAETEARHQAALAETKLAEASAASAAAAAAATRAAAIAEGDDGTIEQPSIPH
ncbi:MAG: hypothetical protein CL819_01305 [Croceicoccus sp.]|nr:hypothetical protein [Croceicoccus sp.]